MWDVSFSGVYHDPDGLGAVPCFFSPFMSFGGRHEPRGSEKLIIPRGCGGFRGWGEGAARAQREGCVKGLSCVVITMGCHLRYLNHSLFNCFVYYTRLLLGFFPSRARMSGCFHRILQCCCIISTRQATTWSMGRLVPGQPRSKAMSLRLSWTSNRMLLGMLLSQSIERLLSTFSRPGGLKLLTCGIFSYMTGGVYRCWLPLSLPPGDLRYRLLWPRRSLVFVCPLSVP